MGVFDSLSPGGRFPPGLFLRSVYLLLMMAGWVETA